MRGAVHRTLAMSATTPTTSRSVAALAGLVAGAAALGVGELVASLRSDWQSPVVGVAEAIIERVPRSVKDFGVERFGTNDKLALIVGILVFSVVFAIVLGMIARRRPLLADGGLVAFALVGVWGSQQAVTSSLSAAIPSLCAGAAGITTLWGLLRAAPTLTARRTNIDPSPTADVAPTLDVVPGGDVVPSAASNTGSRRMFLLVSGAAAIVAATAAAGGRALRGRFSATSSRAAVVLPRPAAAAAPLPADASLDIDGISTFYTPNADFYRIDTAVQVPQVRAE